MLLGLRCRRPCRGREVAERCRRLADGNYPPFRSLYDLVELDEAWPAVAENGIVLGLAIGKASTRKEAKEKVHYESVLKNKQILCEAIFGHAEAPKLKTSEDASVSNCRKYEATEGLVHLPLDPPTTATRDERQEALCGLTSSQDCSSLTTRNAAEAAAKERGRADQEWGARK